VRSGGSFGDGRSERLSTAGKIRKNPLLRQASARLQSEATGHDGGFRETACAAAPSIFARLPDGEAESTQRVRLSEVIIITAGLAGLAVKAPDA
jgi:hypothetical protein